MKKIVFEIIQLAILYVFITIYGYYNTPEPDNKYSWLISAIMIIIFYSIIKLIDKKNKKNFNHCKGINSTSEHDVSFMTCNLEADAQIDEHINDSQMKAEKVGNEYILIKCFMDNAKILSLECEEQLKLAVERNHGDDFTDEIANDWTYYDIREFDDLTKRGLVSIKSNNIFRKIVISFEDVSLGGKLYEKEIWTLNGLKSHPFWEEQRALAKELLKELQKKD